VTAPLHPTDHLTLRLPVRTLPDRLAEIRRTLARWVSAAGTDGDAVDDIVLATNEALANVVDHAYSDDTGHAVLEARLRQSKELVIRVRDSGRWRTPSPDAGSRGHGMTLIAGLSDFVAVHSDDSGTTVEMHWQLPGKSQNGAGAR
jgi:serine/threonine-protein kinase RsbW